MVMRRLSWGFLVSSFLGCQPHFEERDSLITEPRILAVRAEPPESTRGENVTYEAFVASPEGPFVIGSMHWAFCAAPKPLTENGSVSTACLGDAVRFLEGDGPSITAATPMDACQLFGPDTPPGDFRPRDADDTGGYYQPLRIQALGQTAFAFERIICNLANAPLDVAVDFTKRYVPNQNPRMLPIQAIVDGESKALEALPSGRDVQFEVGWTSEDVETFVMFDPQTQQLVERREAIRAFWYATRGVFENDVTGRDENDEELTAHNVWHAPDEPAEVFVWVVLRDSRGGMDAAMYTMATKQSP